jgi:hypothetical protein
MKRLEVIGGIAVTHFTVSALLFLLMLGDSSQRWDAGVAPSIASKILRGAATIAMFPVVTASFALPGTLFDGLVGWLPFVANSVLWAFAAYYGVQYLRRRRAGHLKRGV